MTSGNDQSAALAAAFVAATERRDLAGMRALFSPDARFWTNVTLRDVDLETRLTRIAHEFELFEEFGFVDARIDGFADGFVIRTLARGSLPDGQRFEFPVCIVADTREGSIVRLEEYLDTGPVAPILAALGGNDQGT